MCEVDCNIDIVPTGREISEIAISLVWKRTLGTQMDRVNDHNIIE